MRSIEEHYRFTQSLADAWLQRTSRGTETLPLTQALGRVLVRPVSAQQAVPPFSNSAMDGFAIRASDVPADLDSRDLSTTPLRFPVSGDVFAGAAPELPPTGHAQRIMTGAPVPESAEVLVIPVEATNIPAGPHPLPETIEVYDLDPEQSHVRLAGSNIRPGDALAPAGCELDAGTVAALIATGVDEVEVRPELRVAVVTTGDEVAVTNGAETGQAGAGSAESSLPRIPDSNGPMAAQLAEALGAGVTASIFQVRDDAEAFRNLLDELAVSHDLIVTTGGISAGAFDVVKQVAGENSTDMWFGPLNMQPGKPQGGGLWDGTPLLCLPGNPVSVWVSFHIFVSPLLHRMRGLASYGTALNRPRVRARVRGHFPASTGRTLLSPVRVDYSGSEPVVDAFSGQRFGSHFVASLVGLDGMVVIPAGSPGPAEGEEVDVLLL